MEGCDRRRKTAGYCGTHYWRWRTHGDPGPAELLCRATDENGTTQPVDQPWNRQGMANNMVQRVRVVVRG